jgi:hypothetical protein
MFVFRYKTNGSIGMGNTFVKFNASGVLETDDMNIAMFLSKQPLVEFYKGDASLLKEPKKVENKKEMKKETETKIKEENDLVVHNHKKKKKK